MTDCTGLSADNDRLLMHKEREVRGSVSNTIGSPHNKTSQLKSKAKSLQERLDKLENIKGVSRKDKRNVSNQIKDLKKQLKEEKKRYLAHRDLHDLVSNHVLKLSASTGFAVDPQEYLLVLNSMSRKLFNMPLVNMNNATTSTILTFKNSMSKWIQKTTDNKNMNIFTKSFGDIWKTVATHDRSGLGFKVAEMAATIPDATWNSSFKYLDDHDDITSGVVQNLRNWIDSGDIQSALFREHDESYVDDLGNPVTGRTFDEMSDQEKLNLIEEDYLELARDLMDGRVRYVVPKEIPSDEDSLKEFVKSTDYKAIRKYIEYKEIHRFHNVIGKDGKRYTYVMVKQGEGDVNGENYNSYLVQRSTKDEETGKFITDRQYVSNGYSGEALAISGLDEGFWEAGEHRPFNYEMRHSNGRPIDGTNLTAYYLFKRMPVQPNSDVVNNKKKASGAKSNNYTIWEAVAKYRSMFQNIYGEISKNTKGYDAELNQLIKKATKNFVEKMGIPPENAKILIEEAISNGGIEANIWQSEKTGTIYTGNSFMKKVQQNYDPVTYDVTTGWGFIDKGITDLTSEIKQITVETEESQSIVEKRRQEVKEGLTEYSVSGDEFIKARRLLKLKQKQLKKAKKELSNFKQMREIDESANAENILKHRLVRRLAHTKHRKPFTNNMLRERDPSAVSRYINNTFKGMHYNKLTLDLLKVLAEVDNPEIAEWLINRVKIATGSLDYNANFLGGDVSFRNISDKLNTVSKAFGKKGEWTPEDIHYIGTAYNMYTSSNLLGMWSAFTNNTQRLSLIEEFGWEPFNKSWKIMNDPNFEESDMYKAVQNSGVLDLINHFSDMLMGERNLQPEWVRHKLKPNLALAELQLAKSKFVRQKSSIFDKLLMDVAGLTEKQKTNVKALKDFTKEEKALELAKKRGQLYDVMKAENLKELKKRIKILNRKLTQEEVGKLASWKLRWMKVFGDTDNRWTTFSGGEKDMRTQAAIIGFLIAEDLGYLDVDSDIPKYMQQAAINAARMSVYNTMFGMSLQWLPDGFGGLSKQLLQYKPYTYHEMVREQRIVENFMAGNENALGGFRRIGSSFMSQFKKGTKYGDNRDEFANRMVRLLEMRMIPTILTNLVMWSPIVGAMGTAMNTIARSSGGRLNFLPGMAVRGYTSPWVNIVMKTLISGLYLGGALGRLKEDKDRKWWNEVSYLFLPPLLSWLTQLSQGLKAFRPWIPLYDEVVNPVSSIYDELTD